MQRVLHSATVAGLVGDFDRAPAYQGLAEALRVLIADGRIPVGVRLPSERELTSALPVSRTTITRAYAELREHGFLSSRQGSGWVATLPASRGRRGDHLLPPGDSPEGAIDLTCAAPVAAPGVLAAYREATDELPGHLAGTGYYPSGLAMLREAIAESYRARGLATEPDQIVVVPGALAGVAVAARALLRPGDRAVLESPTYPNAIASLARAGARICGIDAGPDWAHDLATSVAQLRPALAYLVPDFHNPTGALRSDDERARVAAALGAAGTTALVDESLVQLALDGQAMPTPFGALYPQTISVGSLSKPFWGGLRVGWLRVPLAMVDQVVGCRLSLDLGTPLLEQLVGTRLIRGGDELVAERCDQLRASRNALHTALADRLPDWRVGRPGGGLSLWCELPQALSSALVPHAAAHDVLLAAGPDFAPEGGLDRFLRIPYTVPAQVLVDAVDRLAGAWEETITNPVWRSARPTLVA